MLDEFVIHFINTWGDGFLLPWAMFLNLVYTTLQNIKKKKRKTLVKQMTVLLDLGKECLCLVVIMEESAPVGSPLHEVGVHPTCQGRGLQREWLPFKWFESV